MVLAIQDQSSVSAGGCVIVQHLSKFKSSNIKAATFDAKKKELVIDFKSGSSYRYPGISPETWADFKKAPSKGSFVFRKLSKHKSQKVDG